MNLVTGSTGIIGSHVLLELLRQNKPVLAGKQPNSEIIKVQKLFSYYNEEDLFANIKWIDLDVTDIFSIEEAMDGVNAVYHCAGFVSFDSRKRAKLFKINETGTANVVNACLLKKVPLCHVSSIATINNTDYKTQLDERVFWKTSGKESDYAISKYNAEREVWRGIEEGLQAIIVNPGVVLGPGFWDQSSSRVFNTCYKGNLFYTLGNVGLVSARDVAKVMTTLMEKQHYANRYILIEGNYTFQYFFSRIQENFGKAKPVINASRFILQMGRMADGIFSRLTGKEPTLTKAIVNSALSRQTLSNKKIKEELNYSFEPAEKVISGICKYYLEERKEKAS